MEWGGFTGSMGQMGEFGPRFLLLNSAFRLEFFLSAANLSEHDS